MIRIMSGFEEYLTGTSSYYFSRAGASSRFRISASGRYAGKALTHDTGSTNISYQFTDQYSPDFIVGFAFKFNASNRATKIISQVYSEYASVYSGDLTKKWEIALFMSANNVLQLQIFQNDALFYTSPSSHVAYFDANGQHRNPVNTGPSLLPNRWYYVEWSMTLPSAYAVQNFHQACQSEIKVDGVTVGTVNADFLIAIPRIFDFNSKDYLYLLANDSFGEPAGRLKRGMRFCSDEAFNQLWWDDFYLIDNQIIHGVKYTDVDGNITDKYNTNNTTTFLTGQTYGPTNFLGDFRIIRQDVDSAQAPESNDWSIVGTDKFVAVSGIEPDSDTSYIWSDIPESTQSYKFPALPGTVEQFIAVGVVVEAEVFESGPYTRRFYFQTSTFNGTRLDDDPFQFHIGPYYGGNPYNQQSRFWHRSPITNERWTVDEVNTLEIGVKGV